MARTGFSYAVWYGDGMGGRQSADVEHKTFTCCHCNTVVIVPLREQAGDVGGYCTMCDDHTCGPCTDAGGCTPFEKQLEAMEGRNRFLASCEDD